MSLINNDASFGIPENQLARAYDLSPRFFGDLEFRGGQFNADSFSFVSPTSGQDAANLASLFNQPDLLTAGEPSDLDFGGLLYGPLPEGATPAAQGPS